MGFLCPALYLGGEVPPKPRICSPNEFLVMYPDSDAAYALTAQIVARFSNVGFSIEQWVLPGEYDGKSDTGTEVVRHYVSSRVGAGGEPICCHRR